MSEPGRPVRKRRRPVISCEECRRRKIKCDRTFPCKHCRQIEATCNYSEGSGPLCSESTGVGGPISDVVPIASVTHDDLAVARHRHGDSESARKQSRISQDARDLNTEDSPNVRALLAKVDRLEQLLLERSTDEVHESSNGPGLPSPVEPPVKLQGFLSKTRFYGQSHWMNLIGLV